MQMLETIQRKIESARDLYSVVKTMKALAAVNIHYHARAVEAITEYHQSIEMGFQALLKEKPEILKKPILKNERRMGVIIFSSQRGMAGKFNVMVANAFMEWETDKTFDYAQLKIAVTGERVEEQLKEIGYRPAVRIDFPESRYDLNSAIQELLVLVESWRFREKIDDIYLFYNKLTRGVIFEPFQFHLFPLDQQWLQELALRKWPSRNFPLYTLPWEQLLYSFVHQFFYISLYRAFIESMASENASRLMAMQKAEENIEERLDNLTLNLTASGKMQLPKNYWILLPVSKHWENRHDFFIDLESKEHEKGNKNMIDSSFYHIAPSAFGRFGIIWREFRKNPKVYRIFLSNKQTSALKLVQNSFPTACQSSNPIILNFAKLIQGFLSGQVVEFDLKLLALETCSEFQRRVLLVEYGIPRGWVSTYGRIGKQIAVNHSARAVGSALARNTFPIAIPCHRAVRSDYKLGGYQGGVEMKSALLKNEGFKISKSGKVITDRFYY